MGFLTEEELHKLAFDHKYKSDGCSILDGLVMQSFWKWLVEFLPMKHDPKSSFHWTAPNTLTIVGLLGMTVPAGIILWYSDGCVNTAPSWVYIANAICIFIYQTMDALDGKQARRTGSSSPFGELFDHGCDAVSTVFCSLASVCILQGGITWMSFAMYAAALLSFHGCHVQAYHVGHVTFGVFDVTELQFSAMGLNLIAGMVDPNFFSTYSVFDDFLVGYIPVAIVVFASVVAVSLNCVATSSSSAHPHAPTSSVLMWLWTAALFLCAAGWFALSKDKWTGADGMLFFLALGFMSSIQSVWVIVMHMCQSEVHWTTYVASLPLWAGGFNAYAQVVEEGMAVRGFCVASLLLFLYFSVSVSLQIADFLGISIFKVCAPTRKDSRTTKAS